MTKNEESNVAINTEGGSLVPESDLLDGSTDRGTGEQIELKKQGQGKRRNRRVTRGKNGHTMERTDQMDRWTDEWTDG